MRWLVRGGADLVAANAARACAEFNGARSTLVVVTDYDRLDAKHWLPQGVDIVARQTMLFELHQQALVLTAATPAFRPKLL